MRKEKKKRLRRLRERRERQTLNGPELTGAEWTGVLKMAGGGFGFVKVDTEQDNTLQPVNSEQEYMEELVIME